MPEDCSLYLKCRYTTFGSLMPGRSYSSNAYKYGFNGQLKDDEVYGSGNLNSAEFWEYDTRLGRRWNTDPIVKPWESPYASFSNNPIAYSDVHGDDAQGTNDPKINLGKIDTPDPVVTPGMPEIIIKPSIMEKIGSWFKNAWNLNISVFKSGLSFLENIIKGDFTIYGSNTEGGTQKRLKNPQLSKHPFNFSIDAGALWDMINSLKVKHTGIAGDGVKGRAKGKSAGQKEDLKDPYNRKQDESSQIKKTTDEDTQNNIDQKAQAATIYYTKKEDKTYQTLDVNTSNIDSKIDSLREKGDKVTGWNVPK